MKYFIALDKGDKLSANERYIKLSLKNINEKLEVNNNLKALCTFTMSFNNIYELKDLLVAKKFYLRDKFITN